LSTPRSRSGSAVPSKLSAGRSALTRRCEREGRWCGRRRGCC
jgi:hypothetical protein